MDPNENLRQRQGKLPSTEVDAQEEMITPADIDNNEEEALQEPRSDNTKVDTENPSVSNTMQDNENPNDGNNIEDVKENPRGQTSSQNTFGDNKCKGGASHLVPVTLMKGQLETAIGGIAQNQLKNTNKKVEMELSNPENCRQRVIPSSNSNEEPQNRLNTLREKVERLNTIVNEETNSRAENASERSIQRNIHSTVHQVFDGIRQMREMVSDELISEHHHFRQLLARDRPFLEHHQHNSYREAERQRRLQYYSNQATILYFKLTQCVNMSRRLTIMMNGCSDETSQNPLIKIRTLRGLLCELADISHSYRRNQNSLPGLDYTSFENVRQIQLNNNSSVQNSFDALHRYRMMLSGEIVRRHLHLLHLLVRDRPFLDYMQINSSREAERQRRLRYYSNEVAIFSGIVSRCRSINTRINCLMDYFYNRRSQIPVIVIRILQALMNELPGLTAENVRHEGELPALDYPDEILSVILPSYIISILMGLVLFYASTNPLYNDRRRFYRK